MAINGNGLSNGHKSAWVPQSTRLRRLLDRDGIVVAPGVYDGITAHGASPMKPKSSVYLILLIQPLSGRVLNAYVRRRRQAAGGHY